MKHCLYCIVFEGCNSASLGGLAACRRPTRRAASRAMLMFAPSPTADCEKVINHNRLWNNELINIFTQALRLSASKALRKVVGECWLSHSEIDISDKALMIAMWNAERYGSDLRFLINSF